jgi:glucoamylase
MAYATAKPSVAQRAWASIKRELDWIVANYTTQGCDLWEEVKSDDFFWNRYTMRKALMQGSAYATSIGKDSQRSSTYQETAKTITDKLAAHVDSSGFVFESTNRRTDTAVIEAFNVGDMDDGTFAPLSKEVITTLVGLSHYFCRAYDLNQQAANASIPGLLYGRYEGDSYDGGNPWVLLTASAATLLYRQAIALSKGASVHPDAAEALQALVGQAITAQNLIGAGDSILNRMKTFLVDKMHMNEQIDRATGALISAKDLTWNYANVLKAMEARSHAIEGTTAKSHTSIII